MRIRNLSQRRLAAMVLAASTCNVFAQSSAPVPVPLAANTVFRTPAIAGVVNAGTPVEFIRDGFKGTEGPLAWTDGSLLFTETQDGRITRISSDGATSSFLENSNGANGLALSRSGEVYAVQVLKPQVGIIYPPHSARVLAQKFEGKPFGRPNDIVLDSQGNAYFTDSGVVAKPGEPENAKAAVYRIRKSGDLQRLAHDIGRPNGIQLSPDEKLLYVADTTGEHVLAYGIDGDGNLGPRRNFAKLQGFRTLENGTTSSGADGLAVDTQGRLFVASSVGVQVFSPAGEPLGTIELPRAPQNLAFAGPDKSILFIVGRGAAYRVATLTAGFAGRAK